MNLIYKHYPNIEQGKLDFFFDIMRLHNTLARLALKLDYSTLLILVLLVTSDLFGIGLVKGFVHVSNRKCFRF